ncbi:methyl-accepting chemotaxis protein [Faecalicatena contorta]|uniref:Methyl-accepting chemotaxis protein n=1 Tax=Faecalicatena contorta TaxID=39482 RepID=A0A316AQT8_9FIRM|nr:methyl-accepting chemotaxis protein [Faecalicatena contorta]PWJ52437.1 methyl-accepting chemotaxis protein [Faecalicatena contorta]SUQ12715.1 methyl-accepting chemotaxis protein [Faecalicatena contorta]
MKKKMKQSTLMYILNSVSLALLICIAVCFFFLYRMNITISEANKERFDLTENASLFMSGSAYLTAEVRAYAVTGEQVHADNYENELNNLKRRDTGLDNMKKIGITGAEQQKIDEMSGISANLVPLEQDAIKNASENRTKQAVEYVYGDEYNTSILKIDELKSEFLKMLDERTESAITELNARNLIFQTIIFCVIVAVAILQTGIVLITRKKVFFPIAAVEREMREISQGNLSSDFSLEADTSEIGMLAHSIHSTRSTLQKYIGDISNKLTQMSDGNLNLKNDIEYIGEFYPIQKALEVILHSLNHTLRQINVAAEQVSTGASQVSSGAQALAAGSTEQASSIDELTLSVERVAGQAEENASNVQEATRYVEEVGIEIHTGNDYMKNLTEAMAEIDAASNQIVHITKVIEDIAFQTNILSLNASIEAARAGEAGKGFAVVADEVRNLAGKSAEAAKQTSELIQNSVATVSKGTAITAQTAQILQEVGANMKKVSESFANIEQASSEQSTAIEEIQFGLIQVAAVVQTNAATAEENSATSEEMSAQADILREEVSKFTLYSE